MKNVNQIEIASWFEKLQQSGYRLTGSRRALIETIAKCDHTFTVPQLLAMAQRLDPALGMATVYRAVETLASLGLVHRVHDQQGCHSYVAVDRQPVPMLVCQTCGRSAPIDDSPLRLVLAQIAQQHSIAIESYWLQLNGQCAECR